MITNIPKGPDGVTAFPGGMLWSPLGQIFVGNFVGNKHRFPSQRMTFMTFFNIRKPLMKNHPTSPNKVRQALKKIANKPCSQAKLLTTPP
jgi:hypothetical protein